MLLSLSWLKEFTPYDGPLDELAHRLTMVGLEVEEIKNPFAHLSGVVIGHVLDKTAHPDADKLSLCKVDIGCGDPLPIVCGAPNVAAGQTVAVAPVGTELPGGLRIKKAKIRGQVSQGMICSETELELGGDSSGIMVLDDSLAAGTELTDALNLEKFVLDIGVTPNRSDCLSVLGIARETAAIFDLPLTMPGFSLTEDQSVNCPEKVKIQIDDPLSCPLYQARMITDCKIAISPAHIRYRLMAVGIRPINNVVDVTNYILMELGQPLHAFDKDLMQGSSIRVRKADQGMKFTTLDNQVRTLESSDLLIWDENRPVALAGVMGGLDTEINPESRNVLLECAVFDPLTIRKTARRLGLSSESSFRFERGVDQMGARFALDRAAALMSSLSKGKVSSGISMLEPKPFEKRQINFRPSKTRSLLAIDVDDDYCRNNLALLGCRISGEEDSLVVDPPSYRPDLEREVDLIEEVGRIYGLDKIPEHLPRIKKSLGMKPLDESFAFNSRIKEWARGLGLNEAVNYSFVGSADLDLIGVHKDSRVNVFNPLSEDQDVMRTDLLPGLMQTLRHNLGHGNNRLKIFEVAKSFISDPDSETGVQEVNRLAIMGYGLRHKEQWPYSKEDLDYTDIKGLVENLLLIFAGKSADFDILPDHGYLFPAVSCTLNNQCTGVIGRVKPEVAKACKAKKDIWFADINLDLLQSIYKEREISFNSLPKFPVVKRDMTVGAPMNLKYQEIQDVVYNSNINILEEMTLVDIYYPEDSDEKKMTFRLTYRHPCKTLKDKEVDKLHQKLATTLQTKLPVQFS